MAIHIFLESYDLSRKTVVHFCADGGRDLGAACPPLPLSARNPPYSRLSRPTNPARFVHGYLNGECFHSLERSNKKEKLYCKNKVCRKVFLFLINSHFPRRIKLKGCSKSIAYEPYKRMRRLKDARRKHPPIF